LAHFVYYMDLFVIIFSAGIESRWTLDVVEPDTATSERSRFDCLW